MGAFADQKARKASQLAANDSRDCEELWEQVLALLDEARI